MKGWMRVRVGLRVRAAVEARAVSRVEVWQPVTSRAQQIQVGWWLEGGSAESSGDLERGCLVTTCRQRPAVG